MMNNVTSERDLVSFQIQAAPHSNLFSISEHLFSMFFGRFGGGSGSGGGDIILHNVTHIDGAGIINDREFESRTRITMGKTLNMGRFKH